MKLVKAIPVEAPQRSEEWHKARLGIVTASMVNVLFAYYKPNKTQTAQAIDHYKEQGKTDEQIADLLRLDPLEFHLNAGVELTELAKRKNYREEKVSEILTGMRADPDGFVTYDMKWGITNEMLARTLYELRTKRLINDAFLFVHPTLPAGASPDGFIGSDGAAEIKCLRSHNHLYKVMRDQQVPAEHLDQIQMQLWITDREWCDFIAYDSRMLREGLRLFVERVPRDEVHIARIESAIKRFDAECRRDVKHFFALADAYEKTAKERGRDGGR